MTVEKIWKKKERKKNQKNVVEKRKKMKKKKKEKKMRDNTNTFISINFEFGTDACFCYIILWKIVLLKILLISSKWGRVAH